jgi:hypothetical protein
MIALQYAQVEWMTRRGSTGRRGAAAIGVRGDGDSTSNHFLRLNMYTPTFLEQPQHISGHGMVMKNAFLDTH